MVKDYKTSITHWNYKNPEKLKKYYHRVEKKLHKKYKIYKSTKRSRAEYKLINESFIIQKHDKWVTPVICGGTSFAIFLVFIWPSEESLNGADKFFMILTFLLTVFFVIYGFTQPKKEHVLNRKDSLLSMTGFFWQKNITMPFEKVEFAYSTGGADGMGSFQLQVIRPNNWQTFDDYNMFGGDCYNAMTFITWYMDKNRPLPPNPEFDTFREQDFERRKLEGFPKPLYPSKIKTPEATKSQQAERKRIGGW